MSEPHYDLKSFRSLCGTMSMRGQILIAPKAMSDANEQFKLKNKGEVLDSIETDITSLQIDNSDCLKNAPEGITIIVDSYLFKLDGEEGYLAFYYNPVGGKWFIKSFHRPTRGEVFSTNLGKLLEGFKKE